MTQDELNLLRELTEDLTPVPDIAVLMGIDEMELRAILDNEEEEAHNVFAYTLAQARRKMRHRDLDLAEANSPTGIEAAARHLKNMEDSL